MIPSDEPTKTIEIPNEQINQYSIVYKPQLRGICELKRLYLNSLIEIKYKDKRRQGKIIKIKDDSIHVTFSNEDTSPTEIFQFNYKGLPDYIEDIQTLETKKEYIYDGEEKVNIEK